jgi:MYXO-CTERM domain-containing protein
MIPRKEKGALKGVVLAGLCGAAVLVGAACSAPMTEMLGANRAAGSTAFPNDQAAYDYFREKGLSSFQAAGIVGNLDQESGVDPTIAQQGGGPGRGIAQWSVGGRWDTDQGDNLVAFAAQEGQSPDSLGVQLDFIWYELQSFSGYGLVKLQATTNVTDAATEFEIDFEGCDIASECDLSSRISYATDVLDAYGNDPVVAEAGTTADGAGSGSEAGGPWDGGARPSDTGAPVGRDAASPIQGGDSGSPEGTSGSGASEDAGSAVAAAASQGPGGCAIATAGATSSARGGWLAAIGVVVGSRRRRRRRTA